MLDKRIFQAEKALIRDKFGFEPSSKNLDKFRKNEGLPPRLDDGGISN